MKFAAYRLFADGDAIAGRVTEMSIDDLSPGDVVIRNAFSSVNYKDALAGLGRNKIIRDYPRIGGIDLFGTVTESRERRHLRALRPRRPRHRSRLWYRRRSRRRPCRVCPRQG